MSVQEEASGLSLGSITNLCLSEFSVTALQMSVEEGQREPVLSLSPQFSIQGTSGVCLQDWKLHT